jgi:hypothetical protein
MFPAVLGMMGGGFSPPSFPDLLVWLEADLNVTLVSGLVSLWGNLSSYAAANDAAQATAARRPGYGTNVLNGKPALQFTGATDNRFLLGAIASTGVGEPQFHNWTIGAVWQQNVGNQQGAVADFTTAGGQTNIGPVLMQNSGNRSHRWAGTDTQFATTTTAARSNVCTDAFNGVNSVQATIYEANVSKATQAIGTGLTTQPITQYRVGRLFQDVFPLNGDIAALFAYKVPIDAAARAAWQTFWASKYGV